MAGDRSARAGTAELLSTHAMEKIIADAQRDAPRLAPGQGQAERPTPTLGLRKPVSIDPERNEALEAERPGEEVFRAVFGSDDEGEGEGGLDD
ncbi:hypothetical protein KEM55_008695 [Ascosphaera atra]|nr:hypothetical protein KEM55_008695 [Ascosphaera atra]